MSVSFLYLHGFASSPRSTKAGFFRDRLRPWGFELLVPDLNAPSFEQLTLSAMLDEVRGVIADCPEGPVYLVGSSLGGSVAIRHLLAERSSEPHPTAGILALAPSFDFLGNRIDEIGSEGMDHWKARGSLPVYHYDYRREADLGYQFVEDLRSFEPLPRSISAPILIVHGTRDEIVSCRRSQEFAEKREHVILRLVDDDHSLGAHYDSIWSAATQFFDLCRHHRTPRKVIVLTFDLRRAEDRNGFEPYEARFLTILREAYWHRGYFGDEFHLKRLQNNRPTVFLALDGSESPSNLVGGSYMSPTGKRNATAVVKEHRGYGVAHKLICASLTRYPSQFTEIETSDVAMKRLLTSIGFLQVPDERQLRSNLGVNASLLKSTRTAKDGLVYTRASSSRQGIQHEFTMYVRPPDPLALAQ